MYDKIQTPNQSHQSQALAYKGPILQIVSYNASAVKIYNIGLVRFENKTNYFYFEKTL
jgi:hypothetical protein